MLSVTNIRARNNAIDERSLNMPFEQARPIIKNSDVVNIIVRTLNYIDTRLIEHGARVGYIMQKVMEYKGGYTKQEIMTASLLGILHDIGAFKTEEVDRLVQFDSYNTHEHAFYGYLFMKHLSPLGDWADVILHHHTPISQLKTIECAHKELAALMNISDRIDIVVLTKGKLNVARFERDLDSRFCREQFELFLEANKEYNIVENLHGGYRESFLNHFNCFEANDMDIFEYLKMLIYSIEFRSPVTVTHTFSCAILAVELAGRYGLSPEQVNKIYYGAMLHDIGKIETPVNILEKRGALTSCEMTVMQQHVVTSRRILEDYIDSEIVDIATRHHEKLNGAGYPDGLRGDAMTISDKIVAVADIISALLNKRSYKDNYEPERVIEILKKMESGNYISTEIVELFIDQVEDILAVHGMRLKTFVMVYERVINEYEALCAARKQ